MDSEKKLEIAVENFRFGVAIAITAVLQILQVMLSFFAALVLWSWLGFILLVVSVLAAVSIFRVMLGHDKFMKVLGLTKEDQQHGHDAVIGP